MASYSETPESNGSVLNRHTMRYYDRGHLIYLNHSRPSGFWGQEVHSKGVNLYRSPIEEAILAAEAIFELSCNRPVNLALSSGVDSQAMLDSFKRAGVPTQVHCIEFDDGLNEADLSPLKAICQRDGVNLNVHRLNLKKFYLKEKRHLHYHHLYQINIPELAVHLWLAEEVGDSLIFSGNVPPIIRRNGESMVVAPSSSFFCYERFFESKNRFGLGHFFLYSSSLIRSFLNLPSSQKLFSGRRPFYSYEDKVMAYQEGGFAVKRMDKKRHGLEDFYEQYFKDTGRNLHADLFEEIKTIDPAAYDEELDYASPHYLLTPLVVHPNADC